MAIAMSWVLIGQVLWRNEHFQLKDVKGTPRMFLSHPTRNGCDTNEPDCLSDFRSLSELPYCTQFSGDQVQHPAECIFADKHTLFADGTVGSQVFIPTSLVVIEEKQHCQPSAWNGYSCDNEYKKDSGGPYYLNETAMTYYADIENYAVQLTSTYHREQLFGTSLDHPGYFSQCFDKDKSLRGQRTVWKDRLAKRHNTCDDERKVPVECTAGVECEKGGLYTIKAADEVQERFDKGVEDLEGNMEEAGVNVAGGNIGLHMGSSRFMRKSSRAHRRQSGHTTAASNHEATRKRPDVFASSWGDTFKLGKLIELANVDLDNHYNMDSMSARMSGTIIEIEATYDNLRPFLSSLGLSRIGYTYRVRERMLPYISRESLHPSQPQDYPNSRRYLVQHGILLDFKVGGEFGFFSVVYLLIMLTTSLALLATAHKIADVTALYIHGRKNNYFHQKYDVSGDYSEMWECKDCGYFNLQKHDACKGVAKWESPHDERTNHCGKARLMCERVKE
jgi:hypothetical protein